VIKETNATTGNITDYLYGDDLIKQTKAANDSYYLYDGLGSTRALTNSSGTITDAYNYEAFGSVLDQTGTTPNHYLFTGEQYDSGLDNYYLRARYYNQNTGRFTQQDSYMGNSQDPVSLHKYLYANTNPVYYTDPSGNVSFSQVMTAVNVIGTLSSIAIGTYELSQGNYSGAGWAFVSAGFWGSGGFKTVGRIGKWWKVNRDIRKIYKGYIKQIETKINKFKASGAKPDRKFLEEIVNMRNAAKVKTRKLMDSKDVKPIEARNLRDYKNKIGPDVDYVLKEHNGSIEAALESAIRSNKIVDAFFWVF
jgi:RHS repeat-associated protein